MSLRKVFDQHTGRYMLKVDHFFDVYEKHFSRFRNTPMRLLEIGINKGGSMALWRNYFGVQCEIHGLDIDPNTRNVVEDDITVHIGSQGDSDFLMRIAREHGPFDLIIDDGSHFMAHQICSFEALYPTMSERGVYVCEDTFTSYWQEYGGEVGGGSTFVEYAKRLVDELHAYWATDDNMVATPFTKSTEGIYFYSGAIVFERAPIMPPVNVARHKHHVSSVSVAELKHSAKVTTQGNGVHKQVWRQRLKQLLTRQKD